MKYNNNNKPLSCILTESRCYARTYKMAVKGILWHSTGCNNTTLRRYVQPSKSDPNYSKLMNLIGTNSYGNHWNVSNLSVGVNAFIGALADGSVTTVQTLPWDYAPWGCGSGRYGSCNGGWIQFEICEDNLTSRDYFEKTYKEACELTAYLCKLYNLDPNGTTTYNGVKVPVILCHGDAHSLGLGSGHVDVNHWFPKFGKSMADVRKDVSALMGGASYVPVQTIPDATSNTRPTLRQGSSGEAVKTLQTRLNELGYNCGNVDGIFGSGTKTQVIAFQQSRNLDDDGVVGPATWKELDKDEITKDFEPYTIRVNVDTLNYRSGPGSQYKIAGQIKRNGVYTIIEESNGWGKLKSGAGWICLSYTLKV